MTISKDSITAPKAEYSRTSPFMGKILARRLLSGEGSTRKTYHIELDIADSSIIYRPGDSIGVVPENDPAIVDEIIQLIGASHDAIVKDHRNGAVEYTLHDFLRKKANLSRISSSLLLALAKGASDSQAVEKLLFLAVKENKEHLASFAESHDIIDLLKMTSFTISPEEFCSLLSPLLPRFYSISSSQKVRSGQVHLTVALASFIKGGKERYGVATHFLCTLAQEQITPIELYVQPTHGFLLPEDTSKDIIMIGPGTGVAPFRAFLEERIEAKATGRHWLFFGERNKESDFYYGDYFSALESEGLLRLDLAFSRDQKNKVYVQHKILENSADMWRWIQNGAYLYICGDAQNMAKDVENALVSVAAQEGAMTEESARKYIKSLRAEKRLLLDVY